MEGLGIIYPPSPFTAPPFTPSLHMFTLLLLQSNPAGLLSYLCPFFS